MLLCASFLMLCACEERESLAVSPSTDATTVSAASELSGNTTNESGQINNAVTHRIHPDKQAFVFAMQGVFNNEPLLNTDEDSDEKYHLIKAIEIKEESGAFHQRIEGFETFLPVSSSDDYGFHFEDFNNDGYSDLQLYKFTGGPSINRPSFFWLWDNVQQIFVRNQQLEELSNESNVTMDGKRVHCYARISAGHHVESWHEYRNDMFILTESKEEEYHQKEDGIYITTVTKKLVNGKMKTVSNTHKSYDRGELV